MSAQMVAEAAVAVPASPAAPPATLASVSKVSVAEYFTFERASDMRYEYVEGELIPMPGESLPHNRITLNFSILFDRAFEGRDCEVYVESIRLRVSPTRYRYPDVMALCGDPITDEDKPPSLLNPGVIVEVLSPSTQATDHDDKFFEYKQIPTLTDYVLAAQDKISVAHCVRQSDRQWLVTEYVKLTDTLPFASLGIALSLADIYRRVTFPVPKTPAPAA